MKRILSLILAVTLIFGVLLNLSSCDILSGLTADTDALEKQIETLEKTVLHTEARIEALQAEKASLEAKNAELTEEKGALKANITALEAEIAELESRVAELENQVDNSDTDYEATIGALNAEIEALKSEKAELNADVAELEGKVSGLEKQLADAEAEHSIAVGALNTQIEALKSEKAELNADVAELEGKVSGLEKQLANAEAEHSTAVGALNTQIETLKSEKAELNADVAELDGKVSGLEKQLADAEVEHSTAVGALNSEIEALKSEKAELNADVAELEGKVSGLEKQLADAEAEHSTAVGALNAEIASLNTQISELTGEKNSMAERISALEGEISTLDATISAKNAEIVELNATVASLNSEISALNARVAELEAENAAQKDEISALRRCIAGEHEIGAAVNNNDGTHSYICSVCATLTSREEHNFARGVCSVCGCAQEGYVAPYERDGDYIYFGEYPQTIKAVDVEITSTVDERGYYLGSDGFRYAGVTASPFSSVYTFSSGSEVVEGDVYYFKVEPIRWRILSTDGETALIVCDSIIANQAYDAYNNGNYSNNYANSDIRAWLNATFYETAFSELQREIILTTTVDNSATSTGYSSNPYACEDTEDNIFLLSYLELVTYMPNYADCEMETSDYSRATGAYMYDSSSYYGNGYWWLRSPNYIHREFARHVDGGGGISDYYHSVYNSYYGVVAALQIMV